MNTKKAIALTVVAAKSLPLISLFAAMNPGVLLAEDFPQAAPAIEECDALEEATSESGNLSDVLNSIRAGHSPQATDARTGLICHDKSHDKTTSESSGSGSGKASGGYGPIRGEISGSGSSSSGSGYSKEHSKEAICK